MNQQDFSGLTTVVAIGIKTTGPNFDLDRIVELAMADVDFTGVTIGTNLATYRTLTERFNPGMPIPSSASLIHGIRDEHVVDESQFNGTVAAAVLDMMEDKPVIAHNLVDTVEFLNTELWRVGFPTLEENPKYCTMERTSAVHRQRYGKAARLDLDEAGALIGLDPRRAGIKSTIDDVVYTINLAGSYCATDRYNQSQTTSRRERRAARRKR